jgi:hypothetical protein
MPTLQQIFWFIFFTILVSFVWRYFTRGSLVGALLGGRITETIGEVQLSSSVMSSTVLKVSLLEPSGGGAPDVAIAVTSKAPLGASVVPFKLSRSQAQELVALLQRAMSS